MIKSYIMSVTYLLITWDLLEYICHASRIVILSGDIERDPCPNILSQVKVLRFFMGIYIAYYHTCSSSMKVPLQQAYISFHKFRIICLSETYLNSETSPDDDSSEIPDYNIIRNDHLSNTKCGEVCVYYENTGSGVHSSFHLNCHHQLVFAKLNLSILYPPPYERNE